MDSSHASRLTPFQLDLLHGFFAREKRFFLTGGGALAGFYFGHRTTEDLDFFSPPGVDLADAARAVEETAKELGASLKPDRTYSDFRRLVATRGKETCIVDLVIDRAPMIETEKARFDDVRVDTLREIAANKICTVLSRSEIKDLVDLMVLVRSGIDLHQAFDDAMKKDAGADPATLSWVLDQITIGPQARLPGGVDPKELDAFRLDFARMLRSEAFKLARKS
jgi:predicted nucleotidyltransferase component of viral defense system